MNRVLMILTSHRLDCFRLTMDLLQSTGSLEKFDRVVLLLNGVEGGHRAYVERLVAGRPQIPWDTISGPRGKGERVANLQNECVRRYPDSLYFKMDEDLFVSDGWIEKLTRAYEDHRHDARLALITPVVPNNATGFHYLLQAFPELAAEYQRLFPYPVVPEVNGPVWAYPQVADWISRRFLDLRSANQELGTRNAERYVRFARRFSINCLVYDYRHWTAMGGIPKEEELAWTQWIQDQGHFNVLVTDTLLLHYSFFVQQDWLDRTSLLEDIRRVNCPSTLPGRSLSGYHLPRWIRIARQVPSALRRRLTGR